MAKAKKEFKARVRKMQKHIKALLELAETDVQRDALYRVQGEADWLQTTLDREFDGERAAPRPREPGGDKKDSRSLAS